VSAIISFACTNNIIFIYILGKTNVINTKYIYLQLTYIVAFLNKNNCNLHARTHTHLLMAHAVGFLS